MERKLLYLFENFGLDTDRRELYRDTRLISVEPKVFDLLAYVIRNREHVVSKDDLIAAIWNGRIVSESALTTCINAARTAIGDSGDAQRLIKTLPRKGIRFVGVVREEDGRRAATASTAADSGALNPSLVPPGRPSIAVLPFVNMSGDPEQEYFSDGLTEDIIAALSRISVLWVIARTSTFTYKGKQTDVKQVGRDLGVRYVMEGSVRRAGDRLRVTAQLIDATAGRQVWAQQYDRPMADLFDIQDEITRSVVGSTETEVVLAESQSADSRPSANFEVRDLLARAEGRIFLQTPEANAEASDLVEKAIRIDPSNSWAHLLRALVYLNGELPDNETTLTRALELARTAFKLNPRNEWAHFAMAEAYGLAGRLEEAVAECERGLEISPNSAGILSNMAGFLALLGKPKEAIQASLLALQLNPRDPLSFWRHSHIATAHFVAEEYEAALQESKQVAQCANIFQLR